MKIIFIFSCSGMLRHVPACSGMFRVPGFIDAPSLCRFSDKPNLKNKFKLAGEEIDKELNIWILLIH